MAPNPDGPRVNTRWRDNFLAELAVTSDATLAADNAGVDLGQVRQTLQREPGFLAGWDAAKRMGYAFLEMEVLRRLRSGDLQAADGSKYSIADAIRFLSSGPGAQAEARADASDVNSAAVRASIDRKVDEIRKRVARENAARSTHAG